MKKILYKIILLAVLPTFIVVIITGFMFYYITSGSGKSSVFAYEQTMRADYDTLASYEVRTVMTALDAVYEKHTDGKISLQEAKDEGANLIRSMKYAENGYFWVDNIVGVNIVSSVKSHEGTDRIDLQDSDGKYIIKEFLEIAMNGGGFCDYRFPKKGKEEPLPKRSYVEYYKPFKWVIGTGNYVDDIDRKLAEFKQSQKKDMIIMFAVLFFLLFAAIAVIIIFGKRITNPIKSLSGNAEEIALGNLKTKIGKISKDEVGTLAESLAIMVKKLTEITSAIKHEASQTEIAGSEMMNASSKISEGAARLASTVEEAASSLEQMQANTELMAENSRISENITNDVSVEIEIGNDEAQRTSEMLKRITNEISIINDIAFQTNILAMNAAIQASKAGENGKGFAVIATQIRELAYNSSQASKKIEVVSKEGIEISENSVMMMQNIVPRIKKAAQLISNISMSAEQQKNGIEQINLQVQTLNELAQQNAAIAEQTDANAHELTKQAGHLPKIISFFKN